MIFNIITLFPKLIEAHLTENPFKKASSTNQLGVNLVNLRDFAIDKRGTVDDKPYGGGTGMLIRIEPIYSALESIKQKSKTHTILLSPRGKRFTQEDARRLKTYENITFISGRYEGIDARVEENLVDETISIGDFVLTGGEVPAIAIMESIVRLLPGVLEKDDAATIESFTESNEQIEFPQYTRPEEFNGMKVPEILLSGHHEKIQNWRNDQSAGSSTTSSSTGAESTSA